VRCRDTEADERTALAALNAAIAMPLLRSVSISVADPGAEAAAANVSWASFGLLRATAADIEQNLDRSGGHARVRRIAALRGGDSLASP
jgi:hypothetical protein